MPTVTVYLPTGPAPSTTDSAHVLAPRPVTLEGGCVGIVNNRWACMETLTSVYSHDLQRRFGVADVQVHRMAATEWLSDADADGYAQRWDAAIVGIGH